MSARPLVVAVHGGTYTSSYFDADESHSVVRISKALGIPVIAIDRPGYGGSSPLAPILSQSSYIQEQAKYLHQTILPFLWERYAPELKVSSIFLYAHSIGGAITLVAASLHGSSKLPEVYPLCGISISGVGSKVNKLPMPEFELDPQEMGGVLLGFPSEQKDHLMLGSPSFYDPAILQQTERLQHKASLLELYDINVLWRGYWREYAASVKVPVLYTLAEHDNLWSNTGKDVEEFAVAFVDSPTVESRRLLAAPHCIELSLQGTGLYLRTFGFAVESAVQLKVGV